MATYLQGVTDFIPQIQPFQPDLNFYGGLMQTKQNQYDQNWNSLNKMYGQYFYADLTRPSNIEKKEEYLKDIEFNLKRVSGLDLSLEQNVTQATQVFKPFYEDNYLMKDMAYTKNGMNQKRRGEGLRNSDDPKIREQYWNTGIKSIDYHMEEFKESTDEESLSFRNVSYTPFVNVQNRANELAADMDLDVQSIEFSPDNRWIIKKKNGELLEEPLQRLFEATLGSDPAIQSIYVEEAYVKRKDDSYNNAAQFNNDRDAAEMDYLQRSFETLKTLNDKKVKELQINQNVQKNKTNIIEQAQAEGEVTKQNNSYLENLREAMGINSSVLEQSKVIQSQLSDGQSTLSTSTGFQNPYGDLKSLRQKVDAGMASYLMQKDLFEAANNYARTHGTVDMEVNPYEVLRIREAGADRRANARNKTSTDNVKLAAMIENGTMVDVPIMGKDSYGNTTVVGVDYIINQEAFTSKSKTKIISGQTTDSSNKDQLQRQQEDQYSLDEMVLSQVSLLKILAENKIITPQTYKNILNGEDPSNAVGYGTILAPTSSFKEDYMKPKSFQEMMKAYTKNSNYGDYTNVDEYGAAYKDKGVFYNTDKLKGVNSRMTEYIQKNHALLNTKSLSQSIGPALLNYEMKSSTYDSYIGLQELSQEFWKKSSNDIQKHLNRNGYKYGHLMFSEDGSEVSEEEFKENLKRTGYVPDVMKREVTYRDKNGKFQRVNNQNFEEQSLKIGKDTWRGATLGNSIAKNVSRESFGNVGHNSHVTLYKANGEMIKLTGESDDPVWNKHISNDKKYASHMTYAGGYTGGNEWVVYEVNDNNKERIQKRMGESHIFGKLGGGLGAYRTGYNSYQKEYDKLKTAIHDTWSDDNVVKQNVTGLPNLNKNSKGTGVTSSKVQQIQVLPRANGTPGNMTLRELQKDVNNIDFDGMNSVMSNGAEQSNFTESGTSGNNINKKALTLYDAFMSQFNDPTQKMDAFNLEAYPSAGGDQLVGAMAIKLSSDFLKPFTSGINSDGDSDNKAMLTAQESADFLANGLVIMSDRSNFNNGLFEATYLDPFEAYVKGMGAKGYTYKHKSGAGEFTLAPSPKDLIGAPYTAKILYKSFDVNTGEEEMVERNAQVSNLSIEQKNDLILTLESATQRYKADQIQYYKNARKQ